jgi:outer membrane autotransporter protein
MWGVSIRARLLRSTANLVLPAAAIVVVLGVTVSSDVHAQTVNPTGNVSVTLGSPGYTSNPITFDPTTNIYGQTKGILTGPSNTLPWAITNQGTVKGNNFGIYLDSNTGQLSVTNSGTIAGTAGNGQGISISHGGAVTNLAGGAISGGQYGTYFAGKATVTNSGTITGTTKEGVYISTGGSSVTNGATGAINGGRTGIFIIDSINHVDSSTVTNSGTITGAGQQGIYLGSGGTVTNNAGATISGQINGIEVNNLKIPTATIPGTVTNTGMIIGVTNYGVHVHTGGSVTNNAGATISGALAGVSTDDSTVTNTGMITGTGAASVGVRLNNSTLTNGGAISGVGSGVYLLGGSSASNQAGATISGGTNGVTGSGTLTNAGSITGGTGVDLTGGSLTNNAGATINGSNIGVHLTSGAVANNGTLSGAVFGIDLGGGSATNSGLISGASGAHLTAGSLDNSGTIGGTAHGVDLAGGTVTNSGAISGGTIGVDVTSGSLTNDAGKTISGAIGVHLTGGAAANNGTISGIAFGVDLAAGGSISNLGTILATGASGIGFNVGNGAGFTNAGAITAVGGSGIGAQVGSGASFTNGGTVNGGLNGVNLAGGSITNAVGATIGGGTNGISVTGTNGIVTNAGTITGTLNSVAFTGTGTNTLILQTGSVLSGNAVGNGASTALVLQGSGVANNDFSGFTSLDLQASSIWTLNGTAAVGVSSVSGTVVVGDGGHPSAALATAGMNLNSGAMLAGQGTVSGNLSIATGAIVAPGLAMPFSTLHVNGNASFASGSLFKVNAGAAGQADKLILSGAATLAGDVKVLAQSGSFAPSTKYTILHANGGLGATTFTGVTSNFAFLAPSLSYAGNDVVLTLSLSGNSTPSFPSVAQTANETAVASALSVSPTSSSLVADILTQTADGARKSFNALSGEIFSTAQGALADQEQLMRNGILSRMRQASYVDNAGELRTLGRGGPELAYASIDQTDLFQHERASIDRRTAISLAAPRDLTFWTQALGGWGRIASDANAAGSTSTFSGLLTGVDASIGRGVRAGFVAGYVHSDSRVSDRASSIGVDSAQFGAYSALNIAGPWHVRGGAAYAFDTISSTRTVLFPGFFDQTQARFSGNDGQVFGEIGYGLMLGQVALEPLAGIAYVHTHRGSFVEKGGAAALSGSANEQDIGYSKLGLRAATVLPLAEGMVLIPHASAEWQHTVHELIPTAGLTFQSTGAAFSTSGLPMAQDSALVQGGLDWWFSPSMKITLEYQGDFAVTAQTHALKSAFVWNF